MDPHGFALRVRLYKLQDSGILATILLHELLTKQGAKFELVQGYLTVMGETCWHVWIVGDGGKHIDLGRILATLADPAFDNCQFTYSLTKPDGDIKVDRENQELWEIRDQVSFWKKAPKKFLEFRSKCHSQVHIR